MGAEVRLRVADGRRRVDHDQLLSLCAYRKCDSVTTVTTLFFLGKKREKKRGVGRRSNWRRSNV